MRRGLTSVVALVAVTLSACGSAASTPAPATIAPPTQTQAAPATVAPTATTTPAEPTAQPEPTATPTPAPAPTSARPTIAPTIAADVSCQRAYWPTTEWRTASPQSHGMDAALLERADAEIKANLPNIYSLLVVKGGDIVFEKYYQGSDETAGFGQRSVTKSILSAVFGITRRLGFFPNLDQPIRELIPDYFEGNSADDPRNKITLRHLLTMTAGFSWNEQSGFGEPKPDSDWAREALNLGMDAEPGIKFNYNSAAMHLLSVLITRATGRSASQIANTYLFGKVGMNQVGWPIDPQANSLGFSGLVFTSRDMARFGYLYLNNGCWDGEQVVPADWVNETTREHSPHPDGNDLGYGYLWWTTKDNGYAAYFAAGYGRQYILVVPALDLVVVMTGNPQVPPGEDKPARYIITDYVIPAVKQ